MLDPANDPGGSQEQRNSANASNPGFFARRFKLAIVLTTLATAAVLIMAVVASLQESADRIH